LEHDALSHTRSSAAPPGFAPLLTEGVENLRTKLLWVQLIAIAILGTLHAVITWAQPGAFPESAVSLVHVDREGNLPTWFSTTQWAVLGMSIAAIAIVAERAGRARSRTWMWWCCALGAFGLSADEGAAIHEHAGSLFQRAVGSDPSSPLHFLLGFPSYYWMLVYAPLAVPAVAILVVFLWRELGSARRTALLGIFVYLCAAVGLDFIEGHYGNSEHSRMLVSVFSHPFRFDIFLVEEVLEMLGVTLVIHAFLRHLSRVAADLGR